MDVNHKFLQLCHLFENYHNETLGTKIKMKLDFRGKE